MSTKDFTCSFTAPVTETRMLLLNLQSDSPKTAHLRHLGRSGDTGPVTAKWQESQNSVDWTDIAGTGQVVNSGYGTAWLVSSNKAYVALATFGNVDVEVKISRSDPDSFPLTISL